MISKLFEVPFLHVTIYSYGLMLVIGFLVSVYVMRRLTVRSGENPEHITNAALYALLSGVIGARAFYVAHHWNEFTGSFFSVFAVWQGGLEFLGGVILASVVVTAYFLRYKLSVRNYIDILVIGLMIGLGFGRIGCFLNGCCFGKPTHRCISVRFPYGSPAYQSQVRPNFARLRPAPQLDLPADYFGYFGPDGKTWYPADEKSKYQAYLKHYKDLTNEQKAQVRTGQYRSLPVHPTQLYSGANAFFLSLVLYLFWSRFGRQKPGSTFGLILILYGMTRFLIEYLRDDNPFENSWWAIYRGATVSQNICIYMFILGVVFFLYFFTRKPVVR